MTTDSPGVRAARKDDHVALASAQHETPQHNEFDDVEFLHHALAGIDVETVQLSLALNGLQWQVPFYINGMTGGTAQTARLNRELAIAARETGVPMATGSVSVALDAPHDRDITEGFTVVRDENPHGFVMANLGVDRPADDARRAVDLLGADALQVHVNAVQETVMPEGSRNFSSWEASLATLIDASPVPVIVKEVGFGLSHATIERIANLGAAVADVSGKGGTDFLRIENARRSVAAGDYSMLSGFGQSALACLLDAPRPTLPLFASGGVRNPYDVIKALSAGAQAVGVAGTFLVAVREGGAAALIPLIERWKSQLRAIMALLGAAAPAALKNTDMLVHGSLAEYCRLRGIDLQALARRSTLTPAPSSSQADANDSDPRSSAL